MVTTQTLKSRPSGMFDRVARARERLGLHSVAHPTEAGAGVALAQVVRQVFVYGTLREGDVRAPRLEALLSGDRLPATAHGALYDIGDYPGLVLSPSTIALPPETNVVHGEFVTFSDPPEGLAVLDALEAYRPSDGKGSLYSRRLIAARAKDGVHLAWTYVWNGRTPERRIRSGDWRDR